MTFVLFLFYSNLTVTILYFCSRQEKFRNNVTCKKQPTCEFVDKHPASQPIIELVPYSVCPHAVNMVPLSDTSSIIKNEQIKHVMEELARLKKENAELQRQNAEEVKKLRAQMTRVKSKVVTQRIKLSAVRKQRDYFKMKCLRDRKKMITKVKVLLNVISKAKKTKEAQKHNECMKSS